MTNKTPSGAERHCECTELRRKSPNSQNVFLAASSDRKLPESIPTVITQNSSILHGQCTTPPLFPNFKFSQHAWNHPLKTVASFGTPFHFHGHGHMTTNLLTVGVNGTDEDCIIVTVIAMELYFSTLHVMWGLSPLLDSWKMRWLLTIFQMMMYKQAIGKALEM